MVQAEGGDATPLHTSIALDIAPSACHLFRLDGPALTPLHSTCPAAGIRSPRSSSG
ncbi:hypothetical protein MPLB_1510136 [Mesorhizobium sp. ORS 3324]|nr:hypothetical protein MPLB_1510136 [Mesorhizobium sp. ORS 3324]